MSQVKFFVLLWHKFIIPGCHDNYFPVWMAEHVLLLWDDLCHDTHWQTHWRSSPLCLQRNGTLLLLELLPAKIVILISLRLDYNHRSIHICMCSTYGCRNLEGPKQTTHPTPTPSSEIQSNSLYNLYWPGLLTTYHPCVCSTFTNYIVIPLVQFELPLDETRYCRITRNHSVHAGNTHDGKQKKSILFHRFPKDKVSSVEAEKQLLNPNFFNVTLSFV